MMREKDRARSASSEEKTPEPAWVKRTREVAGVASIIGILAVTVFAFDHLKPWWRETVEDARERESERKSVM